MGALVGLGVGLGALLLIWSAFATPRAPRPEVTRSGRIPPDAGGGRHGTGGGTGEGTVQQGAFGVTAAARAAGRAYALAPDDGSGQRAAEGVARRALADQGLADAPLHVTVTCAPYPRDCHNGTSVITV